MKHGDLGGDFWFERAARMKGARHPSPEDLERFAALRHMRGGPHFGGGPFFGAVFGGGRGRKRRGDVRLALLLLLAEGPCNGYQLMQKIEERSGGRWRPSPGSVYPTLAQLEDEGLIRASEREGTKLFELTDAGRKHLEEHSDPTPPWVEDDEPAPLADLKAQAMQIQLAAVQVAHAGSEAQIAQAVETLTAARRALYRILAEEEDA